MCPRFGSAVHLNFLISRLRLRTALQKSTLTVDSKNMLRTAWQAWEDTFTLVRTFAASPALLTFLGSKQLREIEMDDCGLAA